MPQEEEARGGLRLLPQAQGINANTHQLIAIFERKTLSDFASSFKDGRYENKQKMINTRNITNCRLFFIVEGNIPKNKIQKINGIPFQNIESSIFK